MESNPLCSARGACIVRSHSSPSLDAHRRRSDHVPLLPSPGGPDARTGGHGGLIRTGTLVYTASLNADGESNSPGTGFAEVTLDTSANTMRVQVSFSGLTSPTTASHIHAATAIPGTGTAGVATTTPTFPNFPLGVTSGTYDQTFDMTQAASYNPADVAANGGTPALAEAALFAAMAAGESYLNIHTTNFPGGEIDGFLGPLAVPEPSSLALAGAATLCGVIYGWRRRCRRAGRVGVAGRRRRGVRCSWASGPSGLVGALLPDGLSLVIRRRPDAVGDGLIVQIGVEDLDRVVGVRHGRVKPAPLVESEGVETFPAQGE